MIVDFVIASHPELSAIRCQHSFTAGLLSHVGFHPFPRAIGGFAAVKFGLFGSGSNLSS